MNDNYIIPVILVATMVITIGLYLLFNNDTKLALVSPYYNVAVIDDTDVLEIKENTTYKDILKKLGKTKDVGSGISVAKYQVNDSYLYISFADIDELCRLSGVKLLNTLIPINNEIGITGTVTELNEIKDGISILVDADLGVTSQLDKAVVTITKDTKIMNEGSQKLVSYNSIELNSLVEIVFDGPVKESYPVQGNAKQVIILKDIEIISWKEN